MLSNCVDGRLKRISHWNDLWLECAQCVRLSKTAERYAEQSECRFLSSKVSLQSIALSDFDQCNFHNIFMHSKLEMHTRASYFDLWWFMGDVPIGCFRCLECLVWCMHYTGFHSMRCIVKLLNRVRLEKFRKRALDALESLESDLCQGGLSVLSILQSPQSSSKDWP